MTETLSKPVWRIEPLERDDIPTIIRIGRAAFAQDRHTLMKMHEKGTNDPNTEMPEESAYEYFENPRVKMLKAVDVDGKIVGFTSWGMWNFNGDRTSVDPDSAFDAPVDNPKYPVSPDMPLIDQLENITSGHLFGMMDRLNRGPRAIYALGISVAPESQSKGVGSALLAWVARFADENGASAWIHLSDDLGGVRALEKNGFKEVNRLAVNLDEYAMKSKPGGGEWGVYTFRYFRREAQGSETV